jgi:hypothetical protein
MRRLAPLLLLLPAACAPQAGAPDGPQAGRAAPPAAVSGSLAAAAARLPQSAAGFTRGDATWHEPARPGLGVTVDYAGPERAAVATVSLYDRAQGAVGGGLSEPRFAREFSEAVREVVAVAGTRTSQQIAERERREVAVPGGQPLACSWFDGTYGRQEVRTLLCLGAAAGRFIKFQVTAPARPVRPVDPMPFVVEVTRAARAG